MANSFYQSRIIEYSGCDTKDAPAVEDIMRHEVFHSTLDWQTTAQFMRGARQAYTIFKESRAQGLL
jgi:hypothetical protein